MKPEEEKAHIYQEHFSQEIRFLKEQQWRTAYYSTALDIALAALFLSQRGVDLVFAVLGTVIVTLVLFFSVLYQLKHLTSLGSARWYQQKADLTIGWIGEATRTVEEGQAQTIVQYTVPFIILGAVSWATALLAMWYRVKC